MGNNVSVGCNASIIGNIRIGDNAKIGSGSVVVKPVPDNCTAIGIPAKSVQTKETSSIKSTDIANEAKQIPIPRLDEVQHPKRIHRTLARPIHAGNERQPKSAERISHGISF